MLYSLLGGALTDPWQNTGLQSSIESIEAVPQAVSYTDIKAPNFNTTVIIMKQLQMYKDDQK